MPWIIYALSDPRTGEVRYIGETYGGHGRANEETARARLAGHLAESRLAFERSKVRPKHAWLLAVCSEGLPVVVSVVDWYPTRGGLAFRRTVERQWVDAFLDEGHRLLNVRLHPTRVPYHPRATVPRARRALVCRSCRGAHSTSLCAAATDNSFHSAKSHEAAVAAGLCRRCRAARGASRSSIHCADCADKALVRRASARP